MNHKISVMITSYNCEEYIGTAISSVVNQKIPCSWEILVGDDGSDDRTVAIVNSWIKKYPDNIKLHSMQRNDSEGKNGTRAARNRANLLRHATGDFLLFLDGDDQYLGTEKIETQYRVLCDEKNKGCACVAHNILANDIKAGRQYPLMIARLKEGPIDSTVYWKRLYFHTNTIMFRSVCKEMMLRDEYLDYLNDNFITYIILQYGQIYYIPEIWSQYNLTGDGLWTGKKRIYGCFRNMMIYDLELEINSDMKNESFVRHIYDFKHIMKHYRECDREEIEPLIRGLASERFRNTILLYNMVGEMTPEEKKRIKQLRYAIKFNTTQYINRAINLKNRIINLFLPRETLAEK